jgi:plasmid stabilization system protein ParE
MTLPAAFRREARREFDDAIDWYEQRRAGLGVRFAAAVESILSEVAINPKKFPEAVPSVREAAVQEFPYCVYYKEEPGSIVVMAVFHSSRDPAVWQARA